MKVSCPNCQKVLQAPDEWAGKKVKCPRCKQPINLPARASGPDDVNLDFGSLEAIEDAGEAMTFERKGKPMTLKQAQAAAISPGDSGVIADPHIRTCLKCGQKIRTEDQFVDLICRHCGGPIPGREFVGDKVKYTSDMTGRIKSNVTFYTGFTSAAVYPIPGLPSILIAMGIGMAVIAVPMLGVLAFTAGASLNPITKESSTGWVAIFLTVMFLAEGVYFGSVAYYALIDTIRTTTSGGEQPPTLTWNVINLGTALAGYGALLLFYAIVLLIMMGGVPTSLEQVESISDPLKLFILALLTFIVPMNIIGLSSSNALDGLNPVRIFRSIGRLLGHYIFLFLIVLLYLGIYVALMWVVMSWAGPAIMEAAGKGLGEGIIKVLGGLVAWAAVLGLGFYFAYSIGRILGLFSRSYREQIDFEL